MWWVSCQCELGAGDAGVAGCSAGLLVLCQTASIQCSVCLLSVQANKQAKFHFLLPLPFLISWLYFFAPSPCFVSQAVQELEAKFQFLRGIYRAHSKGEWVGEGVGFVCGWVCGWVGGAEGSAAMCAGQVGCRTCFQSSIGRGCLFSHIAI